MCLLCTHTPLQCSVLVAHSCLTLWEPMDCSQPGSSIHGILQASILEWIAIPFSRGSSQPRDGTQFSQIRQILYQLSLQGSHCNVNVELLFKWGIYLPAFESGLCNLFQSTEYGRSDVVPVSSHNLKGACPAFVYSLTILPSHVITLAWPAEGRDHMEQGWAIQLRFLGTSQPTAHLEVDYRWGKTSWDQKNHGLTQPRSLTCMQNCELN